MESLEISAKTVEEAVELALERLGAGRDEVEVIVLKEGKSGFLGLGGEEATVRVVRRQAGEVMQAAGALAKETLEKILSLMHVSAVVEEEVRSVEDRDHIVLDITGEDLGILIGRRGNTLASLQYLVYLMVGQRLKAHVPVTIDVEGYRERRQMALQNLARHIAERVKATGQSIALEPMPPSERRIIHLALRDYPGVTTQSIGEGDNRKVSIILGEKA